MGLAVGEEVVDEHADHREQEDDESPENLVGDGAVRLEDLNCGTNTSARAHENSFHRERLGTKKAYVLLQAMMSRTRTMNPTMPPPVPACHGFADWAEIGAASASMKKESCRRAERTRLNILAVIVGGVVVGRWAWLLLRRTMGVLWC